ncbi:sensor domain-containing protein [Rhodanobacter geophilus]|uniref:Sensor domain-containing protein n=1 Tax=Rhodanobacter geophilus TaxID=3162488 RepID=A0ABV3QKA0_9GAMM
MNAPSSTPPRTIAEYLEQLRTALRGADPALVQDALYDAEEHLRAELYERPGRDEAAMLEHVVESYGAPGEVAEIYRDQEIRIQRAIRPPPPPKRRSLAGRFFGVIADPRAWGALFYLLFGLVTGIAYFTWVIAGLSMSMGLSVLIIGLPFIVLFFGSVRSFALLEGRLVEAMLGVRMPRRPPYPPKHRSLFQRIGAMFTDPRSWSSMLYGLLQLPLGIFYFTLIVVWLSVSLSFIAAPIVKLVAMLEHWDMGTCVGAPEWICGGVEWLSGWGGATVLCLLGLLLFFLLLHVARGLGHLHGLLAKHLLVRRA